MATTLRLPELAGAAAGGLALLATALADGPRTALTVALLVGLVVLTRVRYARVAALVVLLLMAGVALSGNGPGGDPRPAGDGPRAAVG